MQFRPAQEPLSGPAPMLGAFAHPAFAVVWTASTCALIGIAMYDTAAGWLMTTFGLDPFEVALLHAATTLPIFLFTLPAGAIADIIDPRRMIVAVSYAIAALMATFAAVVSLDYASPLVLLLTTFVLSAAWSLNIPAWLSILPLLVPKPLVPGAIAAHSVGYNLSRTIGPTLGGFIIVNYGAAAPLWIFVAANLAVIAALTWWRAPGRQAASLPAERLSSALRTGLRHAANNRLLWATLARTIAIYPFTAAYWGLLPLIARRTGQGAEHYGLLLSAISAGAILGSLGHEKLRHRFGADRLIAFGTILTALALTLFAFADHLVVALGACLLAGVAWVGILTCLYTSAQNVLPDWVRGRGLAVFLTVIYGTMTLVQRGMGRDRHKNRTPDRAPHRRGRRACGDPSHLAMEAAAGSGARPFTVSTLEHAANPRGDRQQSRAGPGEDRISDRPEGPHRVSARPGRAWVRASPRRGVRVGNLRGRRRCGPL